MATKDVKGVKRADGDTYLYKDAEARTKIGTATLTTTAQNLSGAVNELNAGKASLENGKVPVSQLPSYVDDVLEYANKASFPAIGESGKIYVDLATNLTYRWSGSDYVEISPSLALGETSSTAYAGNKGKANADAIAVLNGTGTGSVSKAITNAINALDVASVGGTGKYISAISEADGKISATEETMDDAPTENSNAPVKSGGIKTAIDDSVSLKTATGNPITLTDAANANAEELSMTIEPIQSGSGDPSPTNVRPISGISEVVATRMGKNLICGRIVGKVVSSSGVFVSASESTTCYAPVVEGATYRITNHDIYNQLLCAYFYEEPTVASVSYNQSRTVEENSDFIVTAPITGYIAFRVYNSVDNETQIELGSTATDYEAPVTPATATITFGQTVYGGSVNFKTGEVTVTHGMADLGSFTYSYDITNIRFVSSVSGMKSVNDWVAISVFCSQYKKQPMAPGWNANNTFGTYGTSIYIRDTRFTDVAAFKTAMSGVQLCYELATPATLTLTPAELELLKGNNTITANGAEINLKYYPDNAIGSLAGRVDDIPDKLSDLTDDATHRTVSDTEKSTWNGKLNKSGGTMTGDIVLGDNDESEATSIYPLRNGNGSVGTASRAFEEGHFGTLYVNGDDVENLLDEKANESDVTTALAGKVDTPVVYSDNSSPFMLFASGGGSPIGYFSNNTRYIKGGADENGTPYIQLWKAGYDSVRLSNTKALFKVYNHQLEFGIDGIVGSGNGGNYTVNLSQTKLAYLNNITSDVQEQINKKVEIQNNAGFHNSIYRGKNLGTEVTQEQWNAISAGTFDDMYIGDYWTINGVNWRIAAFDYWLHCGDTECTTHHVVLVPDTNLDAQKMNDSNVTAGGYVGSKMYTSYITTARNKVISAFGSTNILSHRQLFSNAVDGNYASSWAWYNSTIDLMSESMVYGAPIGGKAKVDSINFNIGIDKVQLPLFALDPSRITNRASWWLRDVVSAANFAYITADGRAGIYGASDSIGVRPAFGIKA